MVGTFEVDILDALDINGRSTFGPMIPMPYCIVSKGGKNSSTEFDGPSTCFDKLAQLHKNRCEIQHKESLNL